MPEGCAIEDDSLTIEREGSGEGGDELRRLRAELEEIRSRRQAERTLDEQAHFALVIEHLPLGVHLYTLEPDGRLVFNGANPAADRILGVKNAAFVGKSIEEAFPPLAGTEIPDRYRQVARDGVPWSTEQVDYEDDRIAGAFEDRAFQMGPGRMAAAFADITQRKRAEAELQESRALYQDLVQTAQDLIWQCDAEGRYTYLNPAWEDVFGYAVTEMLGRRFSDFQTPEYAQKDQRAFARLIEGNLVRRYETEHRRKDGSPVHLVFNAKSVRDDRGRVVGTRGTAFDISDLRRAEEERGRLEQKMLQAQKLESLGVLAGGIAHDVNNILVSVLGNADLALECLGPESPAVAYLGQIEHAARRAADLAKQMLAYSGKGRFLIETIDLNRVVHETTHMLKVSISKKALLRLNYSATLPAIKGDATQVRQVLMNLVINASEALGGESGTIAVSTGVEECGEKDLAEMLAGDSLKPGRYVVLEVADSGCGMNRETQARLFDPFFTTKFTGRGLGMAAALGIVRGHSGAISVASELGRGTTIKVLFPAATSVMTAGEARAVQGGWRGHGKVLLVDDEEGVRAVASSMLAAMGFTAVTAADGYEALRCFAEHGDVRLVILDLTMPRIDGEQALCEMRKAGLTAPVLISSGYTDLEVGPRFSGYGISGFVQKPYDLATLMSQVRQALETGNATAGRSGRQ